MTTKTKAATAKDAIKQVETIVAAGKETIETVVKTSAEATKKNYDQAVAQTKDYVVKANDAFFKGFDDAASFGKDNVEALVAASTVVAKGFEEVTKAWFAYNQVIAEQSVSVAQALAGCKTLREVVDLQNDFAKTSFDGLVAEGTKISELTLKVANEAFEPIKSRLTVAMDKMVKPVAA